FNSHLISRDHLSAEFGALNSGEHDQLLVPIGHFGQRERAASLRDGFYDEHSGHDRRAGKVADKKRLIDGDVLDRHDALLAREVDDAVDEQHRVAMRKNPHDVVDVVADVLGCWILGDFSGFSHLWRVVRLHGIASRGLRFTERHAGLLEGELYFIAHAELSEEPLFRRWFGKPKSSTFSTTGNERHAAIADELSFFMIRMPTPPRTLQLRSFRQRQSAILDTIEQLVTLESPSDVKAAVDRVATVLTSRFAQLGGKIRIHPAEKFGNHLQVDFQGKSGGKPLLLLGHMDTVYPVGTISKMPFRV